MESEIYRPYLIEKLDECRKTKSPELNLFDLHLTEILPEIGEFVWLTNLKFSFNKITKIEHLENLINLKELHFDNNNIFKIDGLDNLENLSRLFLNNNKRSKIEGLDNLVNLSKLQLSGN